MSEARVQIPRPRLLEAEAIARRIPRVMARRGLRPLFAEWLITAYRGRIWLFGVLDLQRIERLEVYTRPDLLHHLSAAIGGRPVVVSNTSGLRYAVLVSRPPRLPRRVDFPGVRRGEVLLGISAAGNVVSASWPRLGHLLVVGLTGSGKSSLLRLLAYQAIAEGTALILGDLDGATFPMLEGHPSLLVPIATDPGGFREAVERALGECDHRARLYRQVAGFPESLEEYNALATREGREPLPRIVVILDEFNSAVLADGGAGAKGRLADVAARLAWRGRKFGVHLIFAAQDFTKEVVGRVRDQVAAAICFRVRSPQTARAVGCAGADRIPKGRPGRAVTDRWGLIQAFYLDKDRLAAAAPSAGLTDEERAIVRWALEENDGYLGLADLRRQFGMGQRQARRLAEEWERRGWLKKDRRAGNRRRVTDVLVRLLADKAANPTKPDKADKA
jgi:hypothetical protein